MADYLSVPGLRHHVLGRSRERPLELIGGIRSILRSMGVPSDRLLTANLRFIDASCWYQVSCQRRGADFSAVEGNIT